MSSCYNRLRDLPLGDEDTEVTHVLEESAHVVLIPAAGAVEEVAEMVGHPLKTAAQYIHQCLTLYSHFTTTPTTRV